jgi:hypothetical protein
VVIQGERETVTADLLRALIDGATLAINEAMNYVESAALLAGSGSNCLREDVRHRLEDIAAKQC